MKNSRKGNGLGCDAPTTVQGGQAYLLKRQRGRLKANSKEREKSRKNEGRERSYELRIMSYE